METPDKNSFKYVVIILSVLIVLTLILNFFLLFKKPQRAKSLSKININNNTSLKIDNENILIGEKVSYYKNKGFSFDSHFNDSESTQSDSIIIQDVKKGDVSKFLAVLYCPGQNIAIDDYIVIKMNFNSSQVKSIAINNTISSNTILANARKSLGQETGKYAEEEDFYIWSLGNKIGEPYIMLRFGTSIMSLGRLQEARIGVWWYESEMEHTIEKK